VIPACGRLDHVTWICPIGKLSQIAGAVLECVPINFAGKTGVPDEVIFPERPIIDAPGHERAVCIEQWEHHAGYRHWVSIHIRNDAVTQRASHWFDQ
jgi:hypothetical protein